MDKSRVGLGESDLPEGVEDSHQVKISTSPYCVDKLLHPYFDFRSRV